MQDKNIKINGRYSYYEEVCPVVVLVIRPNKWQRYLVIQNGIRYRNSYEDSTC